MSRAEPAAPAETVDTQAEAPTQTASRSGLSGDMAAREALPTGPSAASAPANPATPATPASGGEPVARTPGPAFATAPQPGSSGTAAAVDNGAVLDDAAARAEFGADSRSDFRSDSRSEARTANAAAVAGSTVPAASAALSAQSQAVSAAGLPPLPEALAQRLQNPAWGQAIGQRAMMMVQYGPRSAEIQLDPPELGALQIRVHLGAQDQVSVSFSSPHAHVREALEQQMPRLRELFAEQGLNLGQSSVADQSSRQGQSGGERAGGHDGRAGYGTGDSDVDAAVAESALTPVGLVDYYA